MARGEPILVVGSGPTGLMMAAELARHGARCRVVDRAAGPSTESKAVSIQARTLEILDDLGIVRTFLDQGLVERATTLYSEGKPRVRFTFDGLDSPYPYGLNLAQPHTERILREHLASFGAAVEWGVELVAFTDGEGAVEATLRHADGREERVAAPWLVGCDGAHSAVRHGLGLVFGGTTDREGWALADVRVEWPLVAEAHVFTSRDGLLAAVPMVDGRWRLMAQVAHDELAAQPSEPTLEQFEEWIRRRGGVEARVLDPVWLSMFHVNSRHVSHYRAGRVFVAGDAAHIHSPASGQGMNTGLQDAYNLAWKLALVAAGSAPGSLLDSYEAERLPVARGVVRRTELMLWTGERNTPFWSWLRDRRIGVARSIDELPKRIALQASELAVAYRGSPIVGESRRLALRGGDRMPDVGGLALPYGPACRLFDVLRGPSHVLLALGGGSAARELAGRYGVIRAVVVGGADADLLDPGRRLAAVVGAEAALVLVRPDGYVGFVATPSSVAALEAHLARWLTLPA